MKRILLTVLVLLPAGPLSAGEPCPPDCAPPSRWYFRIERVERRCPVASETHKWHEVRSRTTEQEVPCTRLVPVCVTDPCTGCPRTEMQPVAGTEKVKTTCTEVIPVDECGKKTEERPRVCTTIYLDCWPCAGGPKPPATAK